MLAPAGTPAPVLATLNGAVQKAMADRRVPQGPAPATVEPITDSTPDKAKQFIDGELKKWADLVKSTGIKLN